MPEESAEVEQLENLAAEELAEGPAEGSEEQVEEVPQEDPYKDADADKLREVLKETDKALKEKEKSYNEYRSMSDRRFNELRDEIVASRAKQELIEKQLSSPRVDPESARRAQEELDSELAEKLYPEDKERGKAILDIFRKFQWESTGMLEEKIDKKLESLQGKVSTKLTEQSPIYRENKEEIDSLMQMGVADKEQAIEIFAKLRGSKTTSQPSRVKAPGRTADGRRPATTVKPSSIKLGATEAEVLRMIGLDEKMKAEILAEVAEDLGGGE